MEKMKEQIQEMINRETRAWNEKDAETLVSIFHRDMVWPWPKNEMRIIPLIGYFHLADIIENAGKITGKAFLILMN